MCVSRNFITDTLCLQTVFDYFLVQDNNPFLIITYCNSYHGYHLSFKTLCPSLYRNLAAFSTERKSSGNLFDCLCLYSFILQTDTLSRQLSGSDPCSVSYDIKNAMQSRTFSCIALLYIIWNKRTSPLQLPIACRLIKPAYSLPVLPM